MASGASALTWKVSLLSTSRAHGATSCKLATGPAPPRTEPGHLHPFYRGSHFLASARYCLTGRWAPAIPDLLWFFVLFVVFSRDTRNPTLSLDAVHSFNWISALHAQRSVFLFHVIQEPVRVYLAHIRVMFCASLCATYRHIAAKSCLYEATCAVFYGRL